MKRLGLICLLCALPIYASAGVKTSPSQTPQITNTQKVKLFFIKTLNMGQEKALVFKAWIQNKFPHETECVYKNSILFGNWCSAKVVDTFHWTKQNTPQKVKDFIQKTKDSCRPALQQAAIKFNVLLDRFEDMLNSI